MKIKRNYALFDDENVPIRDDHSQEAGAQKQP